MYMKKNKILKLHSVIVVIQSALDIFQACHWNMETNILMNPTWFNWQLGMHDSEGHLVR